MSAIHAAMVTISPELLAILAPKLVVLTAHLQLSVLSVRLDTSCLVLVVLAAKTQ